MQSSTFATSPTVGPRSSQERIQIERLRYNPNDDFPEAERKFIANADRECSGYGYSSDDIDLTVEQIQKTYPESVSLKIIERNLLTFCPAFVLKQTTTLKLDESKSLLRKYFQGAESFKSVNLAGGYWTIKPLSDLLAKNCSPDDIQAFQKIYCFYAATEQPVFEGALAYSDLLKKDFIKECPLAQKSLFCGSQAYGVENETIEFPEINLTFNLPAEIVDVQYYRDGGTIGVKAKDSNNQVIQFSLDNRLNTKTRQYVYLGAMHPSDANAIKLNKGSTTELAVIKLLRSWLKKEIPSVENIQSDEANIPDDLIQERFKIFQIVNIVTLLQMNFKHDPKLFDPEYDCYDLHGGYKCHVKSKRTIESKTDIFKNEEFLNNFGCNTDNDCHATKEGACVTGVMLSGLLKDQINDSKAQCRCLKGPVEYGCVPKN
jgi:hypothetical protein